jgi:hypothetical protein
MAKENPCWGEERIADELSLKRGVDDLPLVRNHAPVIVGCDFFTVVTASFRVLYVFAAVEIDSRRLVHINVTAHPTAEWTLQQFRNPAVIRTDRPWMIHYNRGCPHSLLGPGVPERLQSKVPAGGHRHRLATGYRVTARPVVGGCTTNMACRRRLPNMH